MEMEGLFEQVSIFLWGLLRASFFHIEEVGRRSSLTAPTCGEEREE